MTGLSAAWPYLPWLYSLWLYLLWLYLLRLYLLWLYLLRPYLLWLYAPVDLQLDRPTYYGCTYYGYTYYGCTHRSICSFTACPALVVMVSATRLKSVNVWPP